MKVLILAGGFGTRISEESQFKPKPMIEIGGMPIIWHIMKHYTKYGFNEFVILGGYKQYAIKEYFKNYFYHHSDVTFDMKNNEVIIHSKHVEPWKVTVLDTGLNPMTGGRIKRAAEFIGNESFMLTYGDAVSDVDLNKLLAQHKKLGSTLTITAISIAQAKGIMEVNKEGRVQAFREKAVQDGSIINGGFMVCEPEVLNYIAGDKIVFEKEPIRKLVAAGKVGSYYHRGFWQCMDTKRDKDVLEDLWDKGDAPWKTW